MVYHISELFYVKSKVFFSVKIILMHFHNVNVIYIGLSL